MEEERGEGFFEGGIGGWAVLEKKMDRETSWLQNCVSICERGGFSNEAMALGVMDQSLVQGAAQEHRFWVRVEG